MICFHSAGGGLIERAVAQKSNSGAKMRMIILSLITIFFLFAPLQASMASSVWSKAPLPNQLDFVALLEDQKFELLEKKLRELERKFKLGDRDDYHLLHVYRSFTHAAPELGLRIGAWRDTYPNSYVARVAEGQHFEQLARLVSRTLSSPAVPESERRTMVRKMRRAVYAYRAALTIKSDQIAAHVGLIRISGALLENGYLTEVALDPPLGSPLVLFANALRELPNMPSLYEIYMSNFIGTRAELREFRESAKKQFSKNPAFQWLEAQPHRWRAGGYFRSGDLKSATAGYERALEIFENSWGRMSLGDTLLRRQQFEKARSNYLRALAINPNRAAAHFGIARSLIAQKRIEKALSHLDKAVAQSPYHPGTLVQRIWLLISIRQFDLAKKDIDQAMVYGRFDDDVHFYDGYIKRQEQEWGGAIAAFRKAAELGPTSPRNWRYLAAAQANVGSCEAIDAIWIYSELCRQLENCNANLQNLKRVVASLDCEKALPTW